MEPTMATTSPAFRLVADYQMTGDQPHAVEGAKMREAYCLNRLV
jgi:hypothetical protein